MGYRNWRDLYSDVERCTKCELCSTRTNTVFGEGDIHADVMFIGEGPGQVEDETGRPFVGPAGRMLDQLLGEISVNREDVYLANVLKCRPPRNRNPKPDEIQACMPFVRAQTALVKPKIIVGLGKFGSSLVLGRDVLIGREHGTVNRVKNFIIIPTYHPAALLHNEANLPHARQDFQVIREQIDALRAD